jgi:hypothetical protein
MKLSKVIERLYLKVFVGIVAMHDKSDIVIEIVKGDDVKERITKHFETAAARDAIGEFIAPYLAEEESTGVYRYFDGCYALPGEALDSVCG